MNTKNLIILPVNIIILFLSYNSLLNFYFVILEELLGIVSANIRIPFDATEVIIRLVDGSRFTAFKPNYGVNLICGWAYIQGIPVGIISNNNVIFTEEANKATQFIQLCNMK